MKTIHKFALELKDSQKILMPGSAAILALQVQHGEPCLWALVDTEQPLVTREFITRGTGHPIDDLAHNYIGTYQLKGGDLVFHVLEVV